MGMTAHQAKQLGRLVARARAKKALSLNDLSGLIGGDRSWIGFIEQGQYSAPSPERLARLAEALDIEPAAIDRITKGAVANGLPGLRTYFRAKYDLTPEQVAQVERYVERLRRAP